MNTTDYTEDDRQRLATAVARARAASGMTRRKDLAERADVSLRSIAKIESGESNIGWRVLEAVGRALPGWTEDTPRVILEGGSAPEPATEVPAPEPLELKPGEPDPMDYPDELEYLTAVYWYLRKSMSHEAVMRGFAHAAALHARRNTASDTSPPQGDELGRSS